MDDTISICNMCVVDGSEEDKSSQVTTDSADLDDQRRFSETVAIDNSSQVSKGVLQFALPVIKKEKSEVMMRSVSLPRGTKMEVQLSAPTSLVERKQISLKQRAEAVSTLRQELMIPLMQQRSFSETVAIDNQKQEEMLLQVQQRSSSKTQLNVESVPRAIKMEVEVPRPKRELSRCEFQRKRRVEAIQTQRQEMRLHLDGGKPVFLEELAPQKVRFY